MIPEEISGDNLADDISEDAKSRLDASPYRTIQRSGVKKQEEPAKMLHHENSQDIEGSGKPLELNEVQLNDSQHAAYEDVTLINLEDDLKRAKEKKQQQETILELSD